MDYIEIVNWDKFQAYKDGRKIHWVKLLIEIIDEFDSKGYPKKFHKLPDLAKLAFLLLLCLRPRYSEQIPCPSTKWLKEHLGIKTLRLQPLIDKRFIVIHTDPVQSRTESYESVPEIEIEIEKEIEREKEHLTIFESARELYPGIKVGMETEYANFVYHCKHPLKQFPKIDHLKVLPLLLPAVEKQIEWRKTAGGEFRPEWKNFTTWINQRCWEEEPAVDQKELRVHPVVKCANCGKKGKRMSMVGHKPYCSRECRQKGEGW